MRFWLRELAGWFLVLVGLYFCLGSFTLVTGNPSAFFNAIHTTVIGIFVFRGGIHLLKVALAARVCAGPAPQSVSARPIPPPLKIPDDGAAW